jgi:proteasome lid subunit RPN8/RPN11
VPGALLKTARPDTWREEHFEIMTEDEQIGIGESEAGSASAGEPSSAPADAVEAVETDGPDAQHASDEPEHASDESHPDGGESRPDDESRPAAEGSERQGGEPSEQPPSADERAAPTWRSYVLKGERRRPGDCTVIFARSAYNKVVEHLSRDVSREHGGLLLGHVAASPFSDESAVWIMDALPAKHTKGSRSRLTFTQDTWADFDDVTEHLHRRGLEYKRVGWYHSHPSFGVFLSNYDLNVCEDFRLPTHVALVYDPINHEGGFFIRGKAGYDSRGPQGFREFPNTQPASPVDWRNIEGVEGKPHSTDGDRASRAGGPTEGTPASEVLQISKNVKQVSAAEPVEDSPTEDSPVDAPEQRSGPEVFTSEPTAALGDEGPGRKAETRGPGVKRALKGGIASFFGLFKKKQHNHTGAGDGDAADAKPETRAPDGTGEAPTANHTGEPSADAPTEGANREHRPRSRPPGS